MNHSSVPSRKHLMVSIAVVYQEQVATRTTSKIRTLFLLLAGTNDDPSALLVWHYWVKPN
jgi:hypothetical protein